MALPEKDAGRKPDLDIKESVISVSDEEATDDSFYTAASSLSSSGSFSFGVGNWAEYPGPPVSVSSKISHTANTRPDDSGPITLNVSSSIDGSPQPIPLVDISSESLVIVSSETEEINSQDDSVILLETSNEGDEPESWISPNPKPVLLASSSPLVEQASLQMAANIVPTQGENAEDVADQVTSLVKAPVSRGQGSHPVPDTSLEPSKRERKSSEQSSDGGFFDLESEKKKRKMEGRSLFSPSPNGEGPKSKKVRKRLEISPRKESSVVMKLSNGVKFVDLCDCEGCSSPNCGRCSNCLKIHQIEEVNVAVGVLRCTERFCREMGFVRVNRLSTEEIRQMSEMKVDRSMSILEEDLALSSEDEDFVDDEDGFEILEEKIDEDGFEIVEEKIIEKVSLSKSKKVSSSKPRGSRTAELHQKTLSSSEKDQANKMVGSREVPEILAKLTTPNQAKSSSGGEKNSNRPPKVVSKSQKKPEVKNPKVKKPIVKKPKVKKRDEKVLGSFESALLELSNKKKLPRIPKHSGLTEEEMRGRSDMPPEVRENGRLELEKRFEDIYTSTSAVEMTRPEEGKLKKNQIAEDEKAETEDLRWEEMKRLESDEDRCQMARRKFKNSSLVNPTRNLSFFGKGTQLSNEEIRKKRKTEGTEVDETSRKVSLSELEPAVKRVMKKIFTKVTVGSISDRRKDEEQLKLYVSHFKAGMEEQRNFLKFYLPDQKVEEEYVKTSAQIEVEMDRYDVYGGVTQVRCLAHDFPHKFSLK